LNVRDDAYVIAYTQLFVLALEMTKNLFLLSCFAAFTVAVTSTAGAPTYPRYS